MDTFSVGLLIYFFCYNDFTFKDKLDSLLLEEQFLVNRTGSWMKSVEWLCHLTNMTIEFLQSGMQYKTMSFLNAAWLSFIHILVK